LGTAANTFHRAWWVASAVVSLASIAHAHNPDNSWAVVRNVGDTIEVDVEMATEAAMALLGVPMGTQPAPADREELIAPLTKVATALDVYRFSLADANLPLRSAKVELLEEDGVVFHFVFTLPEKAEGTLRCEARYLEKVTAEHRSAITLVDAQGGVVAGRFLTPEKRVEILPIPNPPRQAMDG
jgi:hypothetical protein